MDTETLWFCITLGGAAVILIVGALVIRKRFARIKHIDPKCDVEAENERNRMAVAMKAWQTGKPVLGEVDDDGNLTMTVLESLDDRKTHRQ